MAGKAGPGPPVEATHLDIYASRAAEALGEPQPPPIPLEPPAAIAGQCGDGDDGEGQPDALAPVS